MKIIPPFLELETIPQEVGGSHFLLLCVSTPRCFNVKPYPEMRWELTQHLSTVLVLKKKLFVLA